MSSRAPLRDQHARRPVDRTAARVTARDGQPCGWPGCYLSRRCDLCGRSNAKGAVTLVISDCPRFCADNFMWGSAFSRCGGRGLFACLYLWTLCQMAEKWWAPLWKIERVPQGEVR